MKATVFLGGGRITSALIAGLRLARYEVPLLVHDHHPRNLRDLQRQHGIDVEPDLQRAVNSAQLLVIAVRPASVSELLQQIGIVNRPLAAVSLAAGVPLSNLRSTLGIKVKWVRAMPSPVSRVGRGLTALTFDKGFPRHSRREVSNLFDLVGQTFEIPESKFDAFTVTYSSSHGYHALATLAGAAEEAGLDRKTALLAAAHGLADGIQAWRESEMSLEILLREAATPGGIAASVMSTMDANGYSRIVSRGLKAGISRARQAATLSLFQRKNRRATRTKRTAR
jgi:pyrroline-5-carboxylate reductase